MYLQLIRSMQIIVKIFCVLLFTFIGLSYLVSDNLEKQISKHFLILIFILAFFGVFVDMLHIAIPFWKEIWGLIEDGGEMMIMSIIVWYTIGLGSNKVNPLKI